jgi:hypothetical protein
MKKFIILTITALLMIFTVTSFAKEIISDGELENVTAEVGVTISMNMLTINKLLDVATISWGDSDGDKGSYNATGYAGFAAMNVSNTAGNVILFNGDVMFDIGTSGGTRTALTVRMPTINLGGNMDATMKLGTSPQLTGANVLGHLKMDGFSTQVKSDYIAVFAH